MYINLFLSRNTISYQRHLFTREEQSIRNYMHASCKNCRQNPLDNRSPLKYKYDRTTANFKNLPLACDMSVRDKFTNRFVILIILIVCLVGLISASPRYVYFVLLKITLFLFTGKIELTTT